MSFQLLIMCPRTNTSKPTKQNGGSLPSFILANV